MVHKSAIERVTKINNINSLSRFLNPKNVVVIGGGVWGKSIVFQLKKINFSGQIFAVHPSEVEFCGCETYRNVSDLPSSIDAAFVGVNRIATVDIISQLSKADCGGAVCFASGYSEALTELKDGHDLQEALIDAAGRMPILGPNCYGLINYFDNFCLWPDQHGGQNVDSGVAIITQSSNIMINLTMQKRGLPIGFAVTAGNQAQMGLAELAMNIVEDTRVTALGLYVEGLGSIRNFEKLVSLCDRLGKAIVLIKVGKSEHAQLSAVSHTASLAGSDKGASALMKRLGVARVNSLSEFIETLKIFHCHGRLSGPCVASVSCSGGEASLIADLSYGEQVLFPKLTKEQNKNLKNALGGKVALANPLDYHTYIWGDANKMAETFISIMRDKNIDIGIIIVDFPRSDLCDPTAWNCVIEAAVLTKETIKKPVALMSTLAENIEEGLAKDLMRKNLIPLCGMDEGLAAIVAASTQKNDIDISINPVLLPNNNRSSSVFNEAYSKSLLSEIGVDTPRNIIVQNRDLLDQLPFDFPVVLKALGLSHKTENRGVRLDIKNAEELKVAFDDMGYSEYLIEEMIGDVLIELLVGIINDPAHGFIFTIASGGTFTEILSDSVSLVIPFTRNEFNEALKDLKIAKVIDGYRGSKAINMEQLIQNIFKLQEFVVRNSSELSELEINPFLVTASRAVAVDALIKM